MDQLYDTEPGQPRVPLRATADGYLLVQIAGGSSGGGGSSVTNLSTTVSPTNVVVASDTGADAVIPLADATNAGAMPPGAIVQLAGLGSASEADAGDFAAAGHTHTLLMTPDERTKLGALPVAADLTTSLAGKMANTLAAMSTAFNEGTAPEQSAFRSSVSGDRTRKLLGTDTPSADSLAGTNTIMPYGLLAASSPLVTGFTKLVCVASKKPFSALQVGYIHLGGSGSASIKMCVASTDDPGPLNYALGGSDANLKKCVTPRKAGVQYNTYSANGWQAVNFGGVSSATTPVSVADTGSAATSNIAMSDVIPCASVVAGDGLYYALIRVDDGAAPSTRAGIGYTGMTSGTQYQDDAGFAKVFSAFRSVSGVTDPSLWPADYTISFSDTAQCPVVVRFIQGSIDGDAPITGMMCGDSRFDAAGGTDASAAYRGTAFLLAQQLNAAGKNHHMIRACGGGYTSATYYDRGSKTLDVCSPAWAIYTVYTINDGVPTQAIVDAAKLRAQQFVRKCASKNIRVGLVTAYPLTGITGAQYALLAALDTWAAATGLPYYSPLAAYGNADGTWKTGLNLDSNHMTAEQYRVYAADLKTWLLTWAGI